MYGDVQAWLTYIGTAIGAAATAVTVFSRAVRGKQKQLVRENEKLLEAKSHLEKTLRTDINALVGRGQRQQDQIEEQRDQIQRMGEEVNELKKENKTMMKALQGKDYPTKEHAEYTKKTAKRVGTLTKNMSRLEHTVEQLVRAIEKHVDFQIQRENGKMKHDE